MLVGHLTAEHNILVKYQSINGVIHKPCTSRIALLDLTFPFLLPAMHTYDPAT